jgi:hypothetical protein
MKKNSIMPLGALAFLLLAGAIAFAATRIVVCEEAYKSQ